MIALKPDRDVAAWHTRIRAEVNRRKRLLSPEFTKFLAMLRDVRLMECVK